MYKFFKSRILVCEQDENSKIICFYVCRIELLFYICRATSKFVEQCNYPKVKSN